MVVEDLIFGTYAQFDWLRDKKIAVFSISRLEEFIEEEERHDEKTLTSDTDQELKTMSSGERKKALLAYLLEQNPEVLIMVNPFDNLDFDTQTHLKQTFKALSSKLVLIQLTNRVSEALPLVSNFYKVDSGSLIRFHNRLEFSKATKDIKSKLQGQIPPPLKTIPIKESELIKFKNISVEFDERPVLKNIDWTIKKGQFWQLKGPNGSGKSTLINMITGDSHKGYGQDLTLFGYQKGTGESVWDIKELIGYFSPHMVDRFRGYHSIEHMLISGLHDSVGLYQIPSEVEKNLAQDWLALIGLKKKHRVYFNALSTGEKRLLMTARAMIKHPPLLVLDEPTIGLDDESAVFFVNLVNKFAEEGKSAVLYVSHREETGLLPQHIYELFPTPEGSIGKIG